MACTRREFGKMALAAPAAAFFDAPEAVFAAGLQAARPDSLINGVQIGAITYSFRSMPDQSAEATLQYCVDAGISAIELMGGPVEAYARARTDFEPPERGGPGGRGRGGRRGPDPATLTASWNGTACRPVEPGRDPVIGDDPLAAAGASSSRGGTTTPERLAALEAERNWRMSLSMEVFRDLRRMYNDAGVSIYAVKDVRQGSDEELEFTFAVAEALGASHVTLELPSGPTAAAELELMGDWAEKKKIYAAYHTHAQGSMTAFEEAFAISAGNLANVDFGHFVAGGNRGGTPLDFLNAYHGRIASFHLKDRTAPENCGLNLPWGEGQTPIVEILQLMQRNQWTFPASIELEYPIPDDSDAVREVAKCLEYCRAALG